MILPEVDKMREDGRINMYAEADYIWVQELQKI